MLLLYVFTAWAIIFHRVFDARQVFISLGQRLGLIFLLCLGIFGLWQLGSLALPSPGDLIVSVAVCCIVAFWLDEKTRGWLRLSSERKLAFIRRNVLERTRTEPNPEKLIAEFEAILCEWGESGKAALLFDSGDTFASDEIDLSKARTGCGFLSRLGWATPESLERMRPSLERDDLSVFLKEHGLAVIVAAPRGSSMPSLFVACSTRTNQRPFTYPQVQQLQEIADLMDNTLARLRLSLHARQSEQLATIGLLGASLAHEIRNPLVAIKTFAHLLPVRYAEEEFRQKFSRLIPEEVDRIASLTQQLLDLSNPRNHHFDRISLNAMARETIDLMHTRANDTGTNIANLLNAAPDTIYADRGAIRQVLINLLINAVQSLETKASDRRIQVRTHNIENGIVMEIADNGPGIPPALRQRLFRPFSSTKTKGMGLGLAICADILREHKATIIVPDDCHEGAVFRITFPCPPPSS